MSSDDLANWDSAITRMLARVIEESSDELYEADECGVEIGDDGVDQSLLRLRLTWLLWQHLFEEQGLDPIELIGEHLEQSLLETAMRLFGTGHETRFGLRLLQGGRS